MEVEQSGDNNCRHYVQVYASKWTERPSNHDANFQLFTVKRLKEFLINFEIEFNYHNAMPLLKFKIN